MPLYYSLSGETTDGRRTAEGLVRLKDAFDKEKLPRRTADHTLMLATWNIREFDSEKYGRRDREPIFYAAEIISHFDLVAVQEVRDDLSALNTLMKYLGNWWRYILTDVTEGTMGNRERMAFIYDSRKINFGGLASEVVIPPVRRKGQKTLEPAQQLARTPFMVGFSVGWFKFTICTTHILYGKGIANEPNRIREIEALANFLAARAREEHAWAKNMILLGDFNVFDTSDETMNAILRAGFYIPEQLKGHPSNALKTKHYDQIAFIAPGLQEKLKLCSAGAFDFFKYVYRGEDEAMYEKSMGAAYLTNKQGKKRSDKERTRYYNDWRTFQMSDHLPLWIELQIDFGKEYLQAKLSSESKARATTKVAAGFVTE